MANFSTFHAFLDSHAIPLHPSISVQPIPGQGNGLVATASVPEHTTLFSIPKTSILSTQTCGLKDQLSVEEWESLKGGWGRLILCLMYEEGRGLDSPWRGYLDVLPRSFETPMFWSPEEVAELRGTCIFDKIGSEEATAEYTARLLPIISAHPSLFPASTSTLEWFHIQGSRILSRSFHIEGPPKEGEDEDDEDEDSEDGENGGSGEDVDTVGMVPMADMLNARWGENNARLFYTETHLSMTTTKPISASSQIFNTYAQPPNSDLLRRYGHVDVIPPSLVGNDEDEVELRCDLIVAVVLDVLKAQLAGESEIEREKKLAEWDMEGRVEFWLEEGGDDIIPLQVTSPLPPPLTAFLTLLLLPTNTYLAARDKGKLPRPKLTLDGARAGKEVLSRRESQYDGPLEADLAVLPSASGPAPSPLSYRQHCAIVVRAGEKNVLRACGRMLEVELARLESEPAEGASGDKSKRKRVVGSSSGGAKKKLK